MDNSQLKLAKRIMAEVSKILGTDEVYLVGGATRDIVMGAIVKDWDFCTSMLPEDMIEKIKLAGRHAYTIGEKFGTIGFKVPLPIERIDVIGLSVSDGKYELEYRADKVEYEYVEVTTFRSEVYTGKSRKPEVQFVPSLDEDLARRDFTMNAMVLRSDGTIYDPYGGRLDIYAKQIKTVGLPKERILEDPLRIFRAARFAARYKFKIDPNFTGKARQLADRIFDVSVERWVQELDKLIISQYSYYGMSELDKMGILQRVIPEIWNGTTCLIRDTTGIENVDEAWKYLLQYTGAITVGFGKDHKLTRYMNTGICSRLKFSNDRTKIILGDKK